ncbi:hypothetical protein BGW80DRAFT_1421140 [Lactifluus volemus]|nr:hypothetical protein BGW80DRAFT_1421140 [Lactifluus volemus]
MHSIKQGSVTVGPRLKTHAILISLKRLVPANDVPHRRPRRHWDRRPNLGYSNDLISNYSNFMRQQTMAYTMVFNQLVP